MEHSAAGRSFSAWITARSPRCGPVSARPAAASRSRGARPAAGGSISAARRRRRQPLPVAGEASRACGKGRSARASISACRAASVRGPGRGHQRRRPRPAGPPGRPARPGRRGAVGEQAHALAHGLLVGADARPRGAGSAAKTSRSKNRRRSAGALQEQPVLRPGSARPAAGARPAGRAGTVSPSMPHGAPGRAGGLQPGAEPGLAVVASITRRDAQARPCASPGSRRPTSPTAAPRRPRPGAKKADRLQQVGLARPVRPEQEHRPPVQRELGPLVGAEVGQEKMAENGAGHARGDTGGRGREAPSGVRPAPWSPSPSAFCARDDGG